MPDLTAANEISQRTEEQTGGRSTRQKDNLRRSQKSMINELPMYTVVSSVNE